MSMMPKTNVKPDAKRKSIKPNCKPFKACSNIKIPVIKNVETKSDSTVS
jgi:hypothetical protein